MTVHSPRVSFSTQSAIPEDWVDSVMGNTGNSREAKSNAFSQE